LNAIGTIDRMIAALQTAQQAAPVAAMLGTFGIAELFLHDVHDVVAHVFVGRGASGEERSEGGERQELVELLHGGNLSVGSNRVNAPGSNDPLSSCTLLGLQRVTSNRLSRKGNLRRFITHARSLVCELVPEHMRLV
jgi:hypothetical protein